MKKISKIGKRTLCQCGCGSTVAKKGNKYILGHNKGRIANGASSKTPEQDTERDNNTKKTRTKREPDGKW